MVFSFQCSVFRLIACAWGVNCGRTVKARGVKADAGAAREIFRVVAEGGGDITRRVMDTG